MSPRRGKRPPLFWSRRALADLRCIRAYIGRDDEAAALRGTERLMRAAERARDLPLSGRMVPEFGREEIREILLKHYRIVYRVGEDRIDVLTVFESHRHLSDAREDEEK